MEQNTDWYDLATKIDELVPDVRREMRSRDRLIGSAVFRDVEFRTQMCGLSCLILEEQLGEDPNLTTRQLIDTSIDDRLNTQLGYAYFYSGGHVILEVATESDEYIIDPAYSQYLKPFGITTALDDRSETADATFFPNEEVLTFPKSDAGLVADWLSAIVERFWAQYAGDERYLRYLESSTWASIRTLSRGELCTYFEALYSFDHYHEYTPTVDRSFIVR